MASYIGLIHKDSRSDYGVSFPDFPGLATAGRTLEEARAFAAEALALHIEGLVEDGEALPEPSTLDAIMADGSNRAGVAILVDAPDAPEKVVRVNITMPERVLSDLDRAAESQGMTRSGFIVRSFYAIAGSERNPTVPMGGKTARSSGD